MRIVNTSYINTKEFNNPKEWLSRINFVTGILEELSRYHEVHSIEQINYEGKLFQNNVQYHFLNFRKRKLYFPGRLHNYIKKLKPDIVFVNGLIFPLQVVQLRMKLGRSVKIIGVHHAEKPFAGIKKNLQQWADRNIDAYFFTSKEFGEEWKRNGNLRGKSKVYEIMEASSFFSFSDRIIAKNKTKVNGDPVFLWVGRLQQNKNPLTVVNAFIRFSKINPNVKLYMIYQTEELLREIEALLKEDPGSKNSIQLVGKMAHDKMRDWYNASDFIISGSYYEGSGVAVCEAMSCGCIPILTNIVSFRMMTGRGRCGLLYEAGNENDLLFSLQKAIRLDKERERQKVVKQFREELSFEAIGKKIDQVISSL